jgi:Ca2+-binding RTX toxin-like protein
VLATGGNDTVYSYPRRLHPDRQRRERPHPGDGGRQPHRQHAEQRPLRRRRQQRLNGGSGIDTVSYAYGLAGTSGVTVSLAVGTAQATGGSGSDTLTSIENLIGSAYADRLTGNTGANSLAAGRATTRSMAAPAATPWRVATAATPTSSAMAAMSSARPMPFSPPAAPIPSTVTCQRTP